MYSIKTGVLPFSNIDNKKEKDEKISSEVTSELFKFKFMSLVERSKMDEALKEMQLAQLGITDENTAVKVGKIQGLQVMIMGTVQKNIVNARAVHVETQQIIAAVKGDVNNIEYLSKRLASGIETYIARENLKKLRNDSPEINLDFWIENKNKPGKTQTESNKIGDSVVIHFKANKNGFVTIVDIQPGGDVVVLFPNDFSESNNIKADTEYSIPSVTDGFEITVTEPVGKDTIVAFFTLKKSEWLDRKKLSGEGFWSVKENEKLAFTRALNITATGLNKSEWESKTIDIEVVK